jgi:hypothetical protein
MPCALIGGYQRFGGTYCFHLQGWQGWRWRQYDLLKRLCLSKSPYDVIIHKTNIRIVKASNLKRTKKISTFHKIGKFLDQLRNYQMFEEGLEPWWTQSFVLRTQHQTLNVLGPLTNKVTNCWQQNPQCDVYTRSCSSGTQRDVLCSHQRYPPWKDQVPYPSLLC